VPTSFVAFMEIKGDKSTENDSFRTNYSFVNSFDFMGLSVFAQSFLSAVYKVAFIFCAAAMNSASYTVMFWDMAMCIASSFNSLVVVIVNPSYSFVRSSTAKFASSDVRSLSKFVCFQITFRHSTYAMSTVQRVYPFFRKLVTSFLASLEPDSLSNSFERMLESRISFIVLCPL